MSRLRDTLLELMNQDTYRPLSYHELQSRFAPEKRDRKIFSKEIQEMEEQGLLYRNKRDRFGLPRHMNLYTGTLSINQRGFGFVDTGVEGERDIFIAASGINGAMHGDKVIVRRIGRQPERDREEGEIIKVTERAVHDVVGRYESSKNYGFVIPSDKHLVEDIFVPGKESMQAKTGDIVVCRITEFPKKGRNAEGRVVEILGSAGDAKVDLLSIIRQHGISEVFPPKVLKQAQEIAEEVPEKDLQGRVDYRDHLVFTIDGADAKDLDDAISIETLPGGGYRLGVHIADVTHYVRENTPIDREAWKRGTSVYLVDTVIPMLPEKLSNGVCSLHPGVNRLALSCVMDISAEGKVTSHKIEETVIVSKHRLVYEDVSDLLEPEAKAPVKEHFTENPSLTQALQDAKALAEILIERRHTRGAMDFDFSESKIMMDEEGNVRDIVKYDRRIANRMIEEFMLIANETVAEQFYWLQMPFVYRIHEEPNAEKMENFGRFIGAFGYHLHKDPSQIHPKQLQELLEKVHGKPEEMVISMLMLRSLKKARYSPAASGHFGLSAKYYAHFTSPIRRYPDLQIHRIIKEYLHHKITQKRLEALKEIVEKTSVQASTAERKADEAERAVDDLRKAQFMQSRIGEEFDGFISSVTSFGMFVELYNTVEGLIRLHSLTDDFYTYNEEDLTLTGRNSRRVFRIGDPIRIRVESVSEEQREIDFSLVETPLSTHSQTDMVH